MQEIRACCWDYGLFPFSTAKAARRIISETMKMGFCWVLQFQRMRRINPSTFATVTREKFPPNGLKRRIRDGCYPSVLCICEILVDGYVYSVLGALQHPFLVHLRRNHGIIDLLIAIRRAYKIMVVGSKDDFIGQNVERIKVFHLLRFVVRTT